MVGVYRMNVEVSLPCIWSAEGKINSDEFTIHFGLSLRVLTSVRTSIFVLCQVGIQDND